ncbi:ribonuclease HI family protein [Patescibacteria group bacterium]|nr:ribonuclease HI family protein [Patescibacteria group bacterium]
MEKYTLHTDGGSRGNPGPSAAGIVLYNSKNEVVRKGGKYLGNGTNNEAEYQALLIGLKTAIQEGVKNLECVLDSELIVKQMKGLYKIKSPNLQKFSMEIKKLEKNFDSIDYKHVGREKNSEADAMVNLALDKVLS